jgi:oxaloacetate decarboxylase alpha subunit
VDPNVLDKIAKGQQPITVRPGSLVPPTVDRIRKELGPKVSDEDLLLSLFFMPQVLADMKAAGGMRLDDPLKGSDLVELVRGVAAGGKVKSFSLVQPT